MDKKIEVISSYAKDDVYKSDGRLISSSLAGPAYWITQTLKLHDTSYELTTGNNPAHVEITLTKNSETGKILSTSPITYDRVLRTNCKIISTVQDEFGIDNIVKMEGLIALDIQGFLRNLSKGEKFSINPAVLEKISILKATKDEARLIKPSVLKEQKSRVLIITNGDKGGTVYHKGATYKYRSQKIKARDTVGAGDTFLTSFVIKYLETANIKESTDYAQKLTQSFLAQKVLFNKEAININGLREIDTVQAAKISSKKIAILINTHGNEPLGQRTVALLSKNKQLTEKFDFVVGNPVATFQNKRFIDADLNRVAPGKTKSLYYEERRAFELISILKEYEYVLDVHQTRANDRTMIILPKVTSSVLTLIENIDIKTILMWPNKVKETGAVTSFLPNAVGIEVGNKSGYEHAAQKTARTIEKFIKIVSGNPNHLVSLSEKDYYCVYDEISNSDARNIVLKDFMVVKNKKEIFTTLLFGRHRKILGYKMKKIDKEYLQDHFLKRK
jgi:succinylglutamate desuccinylase